MPLSENEQRILAEIEKHLEESDPRLAREVRRPARRTPTVSPWWAAAGVVGGFGIMLAALQIHPLLSFVGFLVMVAGGLALERSVRAVVERALEPPPSRAPMFFRGSRAARDDFDQGDDGTEN